jgi:hypothetical protein
MADYMFPLTYKAGLNRDGTDYQPEYCNDGQWIRFNQGKVKKIGGVVSPGALPAYNFETVQTINLFPDNDPDRIKVYLASEQKIFTFTISQDFTNKSAITNIRAIAPPNPYRLFQSSVVIDNNVKKLLFLETSNAQNIASNTKCKLYQVNIADNNISEVGQGGFNNQVSGGMCYAAPHLFLYGENGFVQYSRANNPLDFRENNTSGSFNISNDKVIYAASVRGGSNSPSLLFWTLSKVVRITNTSEDSDRVSFQIDVVSNASSILSSRAVAEYDGLFFWIGTDRFFVYNGVVQEMVNTASINYFFDNLDMKNRQLVFSVINPRFGEIWWYYPEKGQDQANVKNTRALIYNKRENSWYDTSISRDCGIFSNDFGFMATYGYSFQGDNLNKYLWKHEVGEKEVAGDEINAPIISSVTTPFISQAAFNAQNPMNGVDRFLELRRIEPDFVMSDKSKELQVRINTKRYAQSTLTTSDAFTFTGETEEIGTREQGRAISLTFSSEHDFRMGNIMLLMASGDGN